MRDADEAKARVSAIHRIWRSLFKGPIFPKTDRERRWVVFSHLILHFRPGRVAEKTLRYTHTFGLGGMSMVLVLLLAATGVLLMFVYEPSPERAYQSIVGLQDEVLFGKLIRNVHHWSANFLVVVAAFHLLRVFFSGGFLGARQFNWILGLGLLTSILISNFTGYLLPWDQLSYWAITISTAMIEYIPGVGSWLKEVIRGGPEIGRATLIIFYTLHTTVVPVCLIVLMAFHFWRVRKAGGVVIPRRPGEEREEKPQYVLFLPNLLLRELVVASILVAFILVFSIVFDAPLGDAANPGMSTNPAKAPWYFAGVQELLLHFHPLFAVVVIPGLAALGLASVPYIKYDVDTSGVWFQSRKGRRMGAVAAAAALAVAPVWILADEFLIDFASWLPGVPPAVSNGLLPAAVILGAMAGFTLFLKKKFSASNNEAVQSMFILLAVSLVILTATCVWFRGSGMALTWP